jgi:hypothetical protein
MKHEELLQMKRDMDNGIMLSKSCYRRLLNHALEVHPYASPMVGFFNGDPRSTEIVSEQLLKAGRQDPFPIPEGTLRHLFEKHYGPKMDFAWVKDDNKYKNEQLQRAWEIWQQAACALMTYLTGVWDADEDAAKRLRAITKIVGINDQMPASDDDLWASAFSVLGAIRKRLKEILPEVK